MNKSLVTVEYDLTIIPGKKVSVWITQIIDN